MMTIMGLSSNKLFMINSHKFDFSDIDVVYAIQNKDRLICKHFYMDCRSYFLAKHKSVFTLKNRELEILDLFQDSFCLLYCEINSKRIDIRNNQIVRKIRTGEYKSMTASLKTYLLSIAKYKNLELTHNIDVLSMNEAIIPSLIDDNEDNAEIYDIVNYCVNFLLPDRCKHILTLFYYERKTLDEILKIRKENNSKDGLKTSKSKCMSKLKSKILGELKQNNIAICYGK